MCLLAMNSLNFSNHKKKTKKGDEEDKNLLNSSKKIIKLSTSPLEVKVKNLLDHLIPNKQF